MSPIIGQYSIDNIGRVRIFSHSGGYYTIGNMAIVGGVTATKDLCLFDSLYADFSQFDKFVQDNLLSFGSSSNDYRFSSIFTATGGTYQNNQMSSELRQRRAAGQDQEEDYSKLKKKRITLETFDLYAKVAAEESVKTSAGGGLSLASIVVIVIIIHVFEWFLLFLQK
jgi:hypothetical protein